MFQPAWPSSDNSKNKILGRLIETSSSIKKSERRALFYFIRIHVFVIIFVVVYIPANLKVC
jgi:hypothetical protein